MERRRFLRRAAGGAAAWILARELRAAAPPRDETASDEKERTRRSALTISCSSLPFAEEGQDGALREMKKLGFRQVELAMFEGWRHVFPSRLDDPEAHGRSIRKTCDELEVEPVVLHANFRPRAAKGSFPGLTTSDAKLRAAVIEDFRRVVACASAARVPLVNVQPGRFPPDVTRERAIENATTALREMLAVAREAKVELSFENHTGSIAERPEETLALLEGAPGLGLDLDLSHAVANGVSADACKPLLERTKHVAIRNAERGDYDLPIEERRLDFELEPYLEALRDAGVEGAIAIEYFEPEMREHIPALVAILEAHGLSR